MTLAASAKRARISAREVIRANIIVGRARAQLSQEDLAQRSGVSRPTISRIERAQSDVGIDVLDRIAVALGVAIRELFVPPSADRVDDAELAARAATPKEEFIDANEILAAIEEADGRSERRYSRAGRPSRVAR